MRMWRKVICLCLWWVAVLSGGDGETISESTRKAEVHCAIGQKGKKSDLKTESFLFSGCPDQKCYFRYLVPDVESRSLYVGAMNNIFKLNLDNISSGNIQRKELLPDPAQENICSIQVKNVPDCQNHIRVIVKVSDDSLLVCGTGAYSPQKYKLDVELSSSPVKSSGVGLCPFDPFDNATSVYVKNGNPFGIASLYTGTYTNFVKTYAVIFRPPIMDGSTQMVPTVLTEKDNENWLKSPQFASSFDMDNQVYFFFREESVESQGYDDMKIVSRVAKVCKNDKGNEKLSQRSWLSYQKARLLCKVPGFNPDYFDDIQDVSYLNNIFYALFTKIAQGVKASAICAYKRTTINAVFEGKYKYKENGVWKELPRSMEPQPRPGNCTVYDENITMTTEYSNYQLMNEDVEAEYGQPIYYSSDLVLNNIITVFNVSGKNSTLFLVSSTEGNIYKILLNDKVDPPTTSVLTVYELYLDQRTIWTMELVNATLFVGSDQSVDQFNIDVCDYTSMDLCGEDPYCVFCARRRNEKGFVGDCIPVPDNTNSSCLKTYSVELIPAGVMVDKYLVDEGWSLYSDEKITAINATFTVLKVAYVLTVTGPISWHFNNAEQPLDMGSDYLLSTDNSLVIQKLYPNKTGQYTAKETLNDSTCRQVANYTVTVETDDLAAWRVSFQMWSQQFVEYKNCVKGCCGGN